jgi:hypothetical protein
MRRKLAQPRSATARRMFTGSSPRQGAAVNMRNGVPHARHRLVRSARASHETPCLKDAPTPSHFRRTRSIRGCALRTRDRYAPILTRSRSRCSLALRLPFGPCSQRFSIPSRPVLYGERTQDVGANNLQQRHVFHEKRNLTLGSESWTRYLSQNQPGAHMKTVTQKWKATPGVVACYTGTRSQVIGRHQRLRVVAIARADWLKVETLNLVGKPIGSAVVKAKHIAPIQNDFFVRH